MLPLTAKITAPKAGIIDSKTEYHGNLPDRHAESVRTNIGTHRKRQANIALLSEDSRRFKLVISFLTSEAVFEVL